MGLIRAWLQRFRRRKSFEEAAIEVLREMSAVARQQAAATIALAEALQQVGNLYTPTGDPESRVTEDDNAMLIEMLTREIRDEVSGPQES